MFCPQCGAPNEDDAVFCGNCGAVLNPDEISAETEMEASEELAAAKPEEEPSAESPEEALEKAPEGQASKLVPLPDEALPKPPPPPSPPLPPPTYAQAVQTSGMAIASLVMGIAGWTLLPLIGSILAIVFGYAARREIRQRPDELTGEGLVIAGLVLGWIMVGISVLALCLGAIGLCFFFGLVGTSGY
jgi:uncharacterized Zn finger protein (UPF0148 family)